MAALVRLFPMSWDRLTNPDFLSSVAALGAVVIAVLSIYLTLRAEQRANAREANSRDDAIQARLDPQYEDLRRVFGGTSDGIPSDFRPVIVPFFVLYSDAYAASRDGLLGNMDNTALLDEFDSWARRRNARLAWQVLRHQTWPRGFTEHVNAVQAASRSPYNTFIVRRTPGVDWNVPIHEGSLEDHQLEILARSLVSLWREERLERRGQDSEDYESYFPDLTGGTSRFLNRKLPPATVSGSQQAAVEQAREWLVTAHNSALCAWSHMIGVVPLSYIQVSTPGAYLIDNWLGDESQDYLEIKRLFVDPCVQRLGMAQMLMKEATTFIESQGKQPVLGVLSRWDASVRFYKSLGWTVAKEFQGRQGVNLAMSPPR